MASCLHDWKNQELTIQFPSSMSPFDDKGFKLLEIPLRIVTEIEKDGDLCVKAGNEQTEAVLCTKKATFTLKKTETSNTVYLMPPSSSNQFSISNRCREYFEVKEKGYVLKECCEKVRKGISGNSSFQSLLASLPFSETEILAILPAVGAVVDPTSSLLRVFEPSDASLMIHMLFSAIIEQKVPLDALPCSMLREFLQSFSALSPVSKLSHVDIRSLFELVLHILSKGDVPHSSLDDSDTISLDPGRVAKISALLLIRQHKILEKEQFLSEWSLTTPGIDPSQPQERYLQGILQEKKIGKNSLVVYYELSSQYAQYFQQLVHFAPPEDIALYLFLE